MRPVRFRIGFAGLEAQDTLCILATWIESHGVSVVPDKFGFTPAARVYNGLRDRFGKGQYRLNGTRIESKDGSEWVEVLHADDIETFIDGVEMELVITQEEASS